MKRIVQIVELVALGCALFFVVMLFANEPDDPDTGGGDEPTEETEAVPEDIDGAAIFSERCASCTATTAAARAPRSCPTVASRIASRTSPTKSSWSPTGAAGCRASRGG